jgi:hypothetical protein
MIHPAAACHGNTPEPARPSGRASFGFFGFAAVVRVHDPARTLPAGRWENVAMRRNRNGRTRFLHGRERRRSKRAEFPAVSAGIPTDLTSVQEISAFVS